MRIWFGAIKSKVADAGEGSVKHAWASPSIREEEYGWNRKMVGRPLHV